MRREEYVDSMAELMQSDAEVYRAIVNDLYNSGRYLLLNRFRFLRLRYVFFLTAFALAGIQQLVTVLLVDWIQGYPTQASAYAADFAQQRVNVATNACSPGERGRPASRATEKTRRSGGWAARRKASSSPRSTSSATA